MAGTYAKYSGAGGGGGGGGGTVVGPGSSVDGEVALFSGTTGQVLKAQAGLLWNGTSLNIPGNETVTGLGIVGATAVNPQTQFEVNATTALVGATVLGMKLQGTVSSTTTVGGSTGVSVLGGYSSNFQVGNPGSAVTIPAMFSYGASSVAIGSNVTVTSYSAFFGTENTSATNNAVLSDSSGFTGNYGIYLASTNPNFFGGSITSGSLTASTVLTANGSKVITSSGVSNTTLGYLDATSSIQTQLNGLANQTLSNLTSPTAINQDLLPGSNRTFDIGNNSTALWNNIYANGNISTNGSVGGDSMSCGYMDVSFGFTIYNTTSILWDTDGGGNIGASGTNRPGNIYLTGNLNVGSEIQIANSATATIGVGAITGKFPIYNQSGTLLGYIPIYASIT
jgi:hypothetical protein